MTTEGGAPRDPVLTLEDVGVEVRGHEVLRQVDLVVRRGEPVGLTGPSGSGKTTLCLVLAGALAPTHGNVLYDGGPLEPGGPTSVGLILQTHGLVDGLTAEENVALPLQARGIDRTEIARRAAESLGSVGLEEEASRLVDDLSGGERQRVGIARALALDPLVLIADEPTAELDPENRQRVLALLAGPGAASRVVVVASNDAEVMTVLPRVVEMSGGRVKQPDPRAGG